MSSVPNERESSKRAISEPSVERDRIYSFFMFFFFAVNVNTRYLSLVIKLYLHFSISGAIRKRYVR